MPRQAATVVENNFIGGLVTETTALKFPPNACTETFNCVFDETGRVTRRLGIDFEPQGPGNTTLVQDDSDVYTEFAWTAVGGDGATNFLVQQQANNLFFFNISNSLAASQSRKTFQVDLNTYVITGSSRTPATEQCQYTIHTGNLIVVNPACDPIVIIYDPVGDTITTTAIDIQIRDFAGVDDGLELNERPIDTVAGLSTSNPEHYYNLLNQGWYHGSTGTVGVDTAATLAQWDTARTDLPSNADVVALFRSSETDAFDNAVLLANSPGSTPAPKGHFIFSATEQDRNAAALAEGFTLTLGVTASFIAPGSFSTLGDADTGTAPLAFDGDTNKTYSAFGGAGASWGVTPAVLKTFGYIGKNFGGAPKRIYSTIVYGSSNQGYIAGLNTDITLDLYGKVGAAPVNSTDGTLLGTLTFTDTNNESGGRSIISSDNTTYFDNIWVRIQRTDGVADDWIIVEVEFYQPTTTATPVPSTTERPHTVTTFAGRVFYAGINGLGLNSSIFFTRIIEKPAEYGQCYQNNDPTSEDFSDLLPDDGGVIRVPEIGKIIKLFASQTSLVVIASNGVWLIAGSAGAGFAANDYSVRKLSSIGSSAPLSVVDYKGLPIWWSEDGISTLQFDANYNSFTVVSATDQTIKSFILNIPGQNRQFVKGVFDVDTEAVYWIYNNDTSITSARHYVYNSALLLNGASRAFYPWTINEDPLLPRIRGIIYAQEGARTQPSRVKLSTTQLVGFTYSEVFDTDYVDWAGTDPTDYTSYFITGYRPDGQGNKFFQSNYIHVFMEEEVGASCLMQGLWDFYTDASSGKWSTSQEIYNSTTSNQAIRMRKLKVRGKGRALQLKFTSTTGAPFSIVGWANTQSANAST